MRLRIFVNDQEYTSPMVKYGLAMAALFATMAVAIFILFVLLPVIGISITMVLGLFVAITVGIFAAVVALTMGSAVLAAFITLVDYMASRFGRR